MSRLEPTRLRSGLEQALAQRLHQDRRAGEHGQRKASREGICKMSHGRLSQHDDVCARCKFLSRGLHKLIVLGTIAPLERCKCIVDQHRFHRDRLSQPSGMMGEKFRAGRYGAVGGAEDADALTQPNRAFSHRIVNLKYRHLMAASGRVDQGRGRRTGEDDQFGAGIDSKAHQRYQPTGDALHWTLAHQVLQQALVQHVEGLDVRECRAGERPELIYQGSYRMQESDALHDGRPMSAGSGCRVPTVPLLLSQPFHSPA